MFAPVVAYASGSPSTTPYNLAVADVNSDGKLDALTTNSRTGTLGVLLGNGNGGFTLQANSPSTGVESSPRGLVVADVNGNSKPDALTVDSQTGNIGVFLTSTMLATRAALLGSRVTLAPDLAHASTLLLATGLPADVSTVQVTLLTLYAAYPCRKTNMPSQCARCAGGSAGPHIHERIGAWAVSTAAERARRAGHNSGKPTYSALKCRVDR